MKKQNDAGFTLVEVMVSVVIVGLITIPLTSGMVLASKTLNQAEQMMEDQQAVSSIVERMMATGVSEEFETEENGVVIVSEKENGTDPYYKVIVSKNSVEVVTYIREAGGGTP